MINKKQCKRNTRINIEATTQLEATLTSLSYI
ncbi:hypothetical protein Meth11DRAFT_2153 [Methylophilaceae bacterium 11]|jgi:hypothetical protein|nr:hypothetical protein Meth11DRAFT_2153 [Methylophilaceae bacterium 11]